MTRADARAEAQRLYGETARCWERKGSRVTFDAEGMPTDTPYTRCEIWGDTKTLLGSGDSWEAAFLDADRRAK